MKRTHPRTLARRLAAALALGFSLSSASLAGAQTVFVSLGGKSNGSTVVAIPAPDHGWTHSAAAPIDGTQWNRLRRPSGVNVADPSLIINGKPGEGRLGEYAISTADDIPLVDPQGNPTAARLRIKVSVFALASDKARSEPSIHTKSRSAVPVGLMDASWRVYLAQNSFTFTISGLVPGRAYDLYLYGAGNDPDSAENPAGDGQGARFSLAAENIPTGSSGSIETLGGYYSSLYTFDPATGNMALSPAGTTWARLPAVANGRGVVAFSTSRNSKGYHYVNGFQLVEPGK